MRLSDSGSNQSTARWRLFSGNRNYSGYPASHTGRYRCYCLWISVANNDRGIRSVHLPLSQRTIHLGQTLQAMSATEIKWSILYHGAFRHTLASAHNQPQLQTTGTVALTSCNETNVRYSPCSRKGIATRSTRAKGETRNDFQGSRVNWNTVPIFTILSKRKSCWRYESAIYKI